MFDIKKEQITGTTNKLLYNIWQELRNKPQEVKTVSKEEKKIICKVCGKEYNNVGAMLACSRKHKKEAGNNV